MAGQITMAMRLAFNRIDAGTSDLLRQHKDFIMAELPPILDSFYGHVGQFAETNAFFRSREHMAAAKAAQIRHWGTIMDGRFDDVYEASVRRIGETHYRIGLEPHWYIGGYNALVSGLLAVVGKRATSPSPKGLFGRGGVPADDTRTELQIAINKAAMLDMDLAISVYIEAGQRDLNSLASSVVQMVGAVADTTQLLQGAADQLSGTAQTSTDRTTMVAAAAEEASVSQPLPKSCPPRCKRSAGRSRSRRTGQARLCKR
jgi:hypothetical protein